MKLEVGKEYKTEGGWKAVPAEYNVTIYKVTHYGNGHDETTPIWHYSDGRSNIGMREYDIVSEWKEPEVDLTKIEKPFGLLDKGTQDRLRAWGHGWEQYSCGGCWCKILEPLWGMTSTYRAKPKPVVEFKRTDFKSPHTSYYYSVCEKFVDGK